MANAAGSTCCCLFFLFLVWSITNWWMAPKLGGDGLAHLLTPMKEWEQQGVSLWAAETQLSQQIIDQLREHKVDGNALIALSEESNAVVVAELGVTHLAAKVLRRKISSTLLEEETGASRDARTESKADEVKKAGKKRAKTTKKKKTGTSDAWTLFGGPSPKAEGGGDLDADAETGAETGDAPCPKGTHVSGNTCVLCGTDTYSSTTNQETCTACPAGKTTNHAKCFANDKESITCQDGSEHPITTNHGWYDCHAHGGREKCPSHWPYMCGKKTVINGNTGSDHWCKQSAADCTKYNLGGVRPCEEASLGATSVAACADPMEDADASSEGGGGGWWGWKTWVLFLAGFGCFGGHDKKLKAANRRADRERANAANERRNAQVARRVGGVGGVGELGGQEQRARMRARLNPGPDPLQRAAELDLQRQLTVSQGLTAELQRKMDLANLEKDILVRFAVAEDAAALLSALQELSALPLLNEGMAPHKQGLLLIGKARRKCLGPKRTDGGEDAWTKEIASVYGRLLKIAQ